MRLTAPSIMTAESDARIADLGKNERHRCRFSHLV